MRRELLREGQVFFVHNRVSDIDQVARRLGQLVPDARIAVAHGQMDEGTLERVMVDFWQGRFDVLVCTTIVESGIDLPTVNTLIVDRAERLGLGQLHQLRGRVGRSGQRAYAYLFTRPIRSCPRPPTSACERSVTTPRSAVVSRSPCATSRSAGRQSPRSRPVGSGRRGRLRPLRTTGGRSGRRREGLRRARGRAGQSRRARRSAPAQGYVEADDARLEAYRRLVGVTTFDELHDLRDEWLDRYGPLPAPAQGLLELGELRLVCIEHGVNSVVVLPARVGIRTKPVVKSRHSISRSASRCGCDERSAHGPTTKGRRNCASRCRTRGDAARAARVAATLVAVAEEANA